MWFQTCNVPALVFCRLLQFFKLQKARSDLTRQPKEPTVIGETRQERPKLTSRESIPEEPPKRRRGSIDEDSSACHDVAVELLSEYDTDIAQAIDVLRKLNLPVDATSLVPRRPSNAGSWDWSFPDNVCRVELCGEVVPRRRDFCVDCTRVFVITFARKIAFV